MVTEYTRPNWTESQHQKLTQEYYILQKIFSYPHRVGKDKNFTLLFAENL